MLKILWNHRCVPADERIVELFCSNVKEDIFRDLKLTSVFSLAGKTPLSFIFFVLSYKLALDKVNWRMQNNH